MSNAQKDRNLFDELMEIRDQQRKQAKNKRVVVRGKSLPLELNPLGTMRWYMHPRIDDTSHKAMILYVQEIPPGSKGALYKTQGGMVIHVWKGRGYSMIDGVSYSWEAGDVVQIPIRTPGVTVQHFNDDADETARLICCEPNTVDSLSVDRGSGWEILVPAPEYVQDQE
ncbi:MAG: hypothetical protein HY695_00840 [Deltaproteobacteria bacterium]|nr:hypothetical protein [Deltaproteobacteria bacterium]